MQVSHEQRLSGNARSLRPGILAVFLLLSFSFHSALFYIWKSSPSKTLEHPGQNRIHVRISETSPTRKIPTPRRHKLEKTEQKHKATTNTESKLAQSIPDSSGPTDQFEGKKVASNYVLGKVRDRLTEYLTYPLLARRRGWEGTVLISFQLAPTGRIHNIQINKSSGFNILDDAALKAFKKIGSIDIRSALFELSKKSLQLPVVYQLKG